MIAWATEREREEGWDGLCGLASRGEEAESSKVERRGEEKVGGWMMGLPPWI